MTEHRFSLAGVIGRPIGHSKSPRLHRYWLRRYGIAGDYVPLPVSDENLRHVLHTLPRMGFVGVNITIPHKISVLDIADQVTDRATLIGAANMLTYGADGRIYADNTDGYGFIANLRHGAPNWDPTSGPATVLGAGGAARAILSSLLEAGVPRIFLSNRTRPKAEILKEDFGSRIEVIDWVKAGNVIEDSTTLVNTTSLGMQGAAEFRVPLDGLRPGTLVTDLVYAPLRTRLLETAEAMGCQTVDGLGMLLHQAVPAFERWFGQKPEVDDATRAAILE